MRWSSKKLWAGIAGGVLLALVVVGLVVRSWVVPTLIVGAIRSQYDGRVAIEGYWLDGSSAGVVGLVLHEGEAADAPAWATVERVATDLSIGGLLRGRFTPGRITLDEPRITYRIDREGMPLTQIPIVEKEEASEPADLPRVVVVDARVTFAQEGRSELIVAGVDGALEPEPGGGGRLSAEADDATWGRWTAEGRIEPGLEAISVRLEGRDITSDPEKVRSIPFVPPDVWDHVEPRGTVEVDLALDVLAEAEPPVRVRTEVACRGTTVGLPTLGITADEATGVLAVEGGRVSLTDFQGRSLGGRVEAGGTLDFGPAIPLIDLTLGLDHVDVAQAPPEWQLGELQATGRMTGQAHLRIALDPQGADLTGTTGEAVIEDGTLQEIPIKSLRLVLHAEGQELHYDAGQPEAGAGLAPALPMLVALQVPAPESAQPEPKADAPPPAAEPAAPRFRLPTSITTEIELEDVEVVQLLAKLQALGIRIPVAIAGRVSVKAEGEIPLGSLRDVANYEIHGEATLTDTTIDGVDLGRLSGRLDLANGILELTDLLGRLVDLPDGGLDHRPGAAEPPPLEGPLPPGGFRGHLRAELSPPGEIKAGFEGEQLPLGELAAPALPRPTPLSGLLTIRADALGRVEALADPKAWSASGRALSVRIRYRDATIDDVSTSFALEGGRLEVPDFEAHLAGRPFEAQASLGLAEPFDFSGSLEVNEWDLGEVLAFVPALPRPSPIVGTLRTRAEGRGTLRPLDIQTRGSGLLGRFQAGPIPLGSVPFRWVTEGDAVDVSIVKAQPFGGKLSGGARIPFRGEDRTIRGRLDLAGVDLAGLAEALPGESLPMTGRADGRASFVVEPGAEEPVRADVQLAAPDLTVRGLPAEAVRADLRVREGVLEFEAQADSLGGKVRIKGGLPLGLPGESAETGTGANAGRAPADGEVQLAGFALGPLWRALGVASPLAQLDGLGAVRANVRVGMDPFAVSARGVAELRDLIWGRDYVIGNLRAEVAYAPTVWRVEPLSGELLGGALQGHLRGEATPGGPGRTTFDLQLERLSLPRLLAIAPDLAARTTGVGSLRVGGRSDGGLRADALFRVGRAQVAGMPLDELRIPAGLTISPDSGTGSVRVRGWTARLSGGQIRGDAEFRLGSNRTFRSEATLSGFDIQPLAREFTDGPRDASGRALGKVVLQGPDLARLDQLRGNLDLDLYDAALFEMPVFREINRFLGSVGRGVFERGDLRATIGRRQIQVEELSMAGQAVQLHAYGTVGFDRQLDLGVLVNTARIIPESGQALLILIPGLGQAIGAGGMAITRVASFLSDRLLKFHVTGTIDNPQVAIDPGVAVTETAAGFFAATLRLPIPGLGR